MHLYYYFIIVVFNEFDVAFDRMITRNVHLENAFEHKLLRLLLLQLEDNTTRHRD